MRESGQSFRDIERLSSVGFALPPEVQAALAQLGRQMAAPSAALSHFAKEWRQIHDQLAAWASELPAWAIIDAALGGSPAADDYRAALDRFAPELASQWRLNPEAHPVERALTNLPAEQREAIKVRACWFGLDRAVTRLAKERTRYRVEGNGRRYLLQADGSPIRGTFAEVGPDLTLPQGRNKIRSWAIDEARKVLADYVVDASVQLVPEEGEVLFGDIPSVNAEGEESELEDSIEDEKLPPDEERRRTPKAVRQQATPTERKIFNAWEAHISKQPYLSPHGLAVLVARDLGMKPSTVGVHRHNLRKKIQKALSEPVPDKPDDQLKFDDYDLMMREMPHCQPGTRLKTGRRRKLVLTEGLLRQIEREAKAEVRAGGIPRVWTVPTPDKMAGWPNGWEWANWMRGKEAQALASAPQPEDENQFASTLPYEGELLPIGAKPTETN
jgi:hypothetical protein